MSFISDLLGESTAKPIDAIGNAFDKIFTSDDERAQAQIVLEKLKQHPNELQVELNKIEALHRSIFVAGWRPAIGWVCSISLAFYFIPQAILMSYMWVEACIAAHTILPYPIMQGLLDLVGAMLGFGLFRTVEKFGGKTK